MKHSIYIISLLTIFLLAGFFPSATCFSFAGKSVSSSFWEEGIRSQRGGCRDAEAVLLESSTARSEADERRDSVLPDFPDLAASVLLPCFFRGRPRIGPAVRSLRGQYVGGSLFGRAPPGL